MKSILCALFVYVYLFYVFISTYFMNDAKSSVGGVLLCCDIFISICFFKSKSFFFDFIIKKKQQNTQYTNLNTL